MNEDADLAALRAAEEVRIETLGPDGTVHRTIIWVVVEGGQVFIRSVNGALARWYREARARPKVALHLDGRRLPFTVVVADDPASIATCSTGLERKYAGDFSLASMLQDDVLGTTLRLDPA